MDLYCTCGDGWSQDSVLFHFHHVRIALCPVHLFQGVGCIDCDLQFSSPRFPRTTCSLAKSNSRSKWWSGRASERLVWTNGNWIFALFTKMATPLPPFPHSQSSNTTAVKQSVFQLQNITTIHSLLASHGLAQEIWCCHSFLPHLVSPLHKSSEWYSSYNQNCGLNDEITGQF